MLVVAFPPYDFWPLSVLAVAVLTLLVRGLRAAHGALVGIIFGLVFFLGLMPWLRVIGIDAWIGLSLLCAAYIAALAAGVAVLTRFRWWPLTTAALWVGIEALRDRFLIACAARLVPVGAA